MRDRVAATYSYLRIEPKCCLEIGQPILVIKYRRYAIKIGEIKFSAGALSMG